MGEAKRTPTALTPRPKECGVRGNKLTPSERTGREGVSSGKR